MSFVVTGTGRCGTTWAADTLEAAGLDVGHQQVFTPATVLNGEWKMARRDGDCSYAAAPLAADLSASGHRVVTLVRHPLSVARSWLSLGMFTLDSPASHPDLYAILADRCPAVLDEATPLDRAIRFWHDWLMLSLPYGPHLCIEDAIPDRLLSAVGRPDREAPALAPVNLRTSDKLPVRRLDWDDVTHAVAVPTRELARKLGYHE